MKGTSMRKILAALFTAAALGAGIAPAVMSVTAAAAPGAAAAMHYEGPGGG